MIWRDAIKILGGVFLIVGTSIGGGMLALPVANAEVGFPIASILLIFCWLCMTASAYLILEVNLAMPEGSNMISMARATLGKYGAGVAWISYLLLLYSLLSAYISGGSDVLNSILYIMGIKLPFVLSIILFVVFLGAVVYLGIKSVDFVNTGLMICKLTVYLLLVAFISPYVKIFSIEKWDIKYAFSPIMVLITSYGFAIIIPSLRNYFADNIAGLRKVIFIGSLIPLIAYILWDAVIMGVIPHYGPDSLSSMLHGGHATTALTTALSEQLHNSWITSLFRFFTSISMLTAFLGVSLSLSDFFADGFGLDKKGMQGAVVYVLTFIPPVLIVLLYPQIFIQALAYAGIFCVILLMLLPLMMAWSARYKQQMITGYRAPFPKALLAALMCIGFAFLVIGLYEALPL